MPPLNLKVPEALRSTENDRLLSFVLISKQMLKLARLSGFSISLTITLTSITSALADVATPSGGVGGGTGSALPNAGNSGLTYLIFAAGALLFIYGMLRLVSSYRE